MFWPNSSSNTKSRSIPILDPTSRYWFGRKMRRIQQANTPKETFLIMCKQQGIFDANNATELGTGDLRTHYSVLVFWRGCWGAKEDQSLYSVGQIALYDGSTPRWVTDAEENFLTKLRENGQNGFLWNRLGNLYFKGGRPELAAAAYEKSLQVDPSPVPSGIPLFTGRAIISSWCTWKIRLSQ